MLKDGVYGGGGGGGGGVKFNRLSKYITLVYWFTEMTTRSLMK